MGTAALKTQRTYSNSCFCCLQICFKNGAHALWCVDITATGIRGSYNAKQGTSPLSYCCHSLQYRKVFNCTRKLFLESGRHLGMNRTEGTGPRLKLGKTQPGMNPFRHCFSRSHYKEKQHSHSQRHNHNHKKMVDHFLIIIIMLIIGAVMTMFQDVPTKT